MIRAVIFDMYETLVTLMTEARCFSGDMAEMAGAEVHAFRSVWRATEEARTLGQITMEDALKETMRATGCWSEAAFRRIRARLLASREIRPETMHPGVLPVLDELRRRGVKVGLITNCQWEEARAIRGSELLPRFDMPVLSCEAGLMKPDAAIFRLCAQGLGVAEADCLFVGDGGSRELEGARAAGMRAVQACWYLQDDSGQPCGRLAGFPAAERPEDILHDIEQES